MADGPAAASSIAGRLRRLAAAWPPRELAWRFVRLGALYWLGVRTALLLAAALNGGAPPAPSMPGTMAFAAGAAVLALVEARRHGELHFLANLGVRPRTVGALWVLPVLLLETLYAMLPG